MPVEQRCGAWTYIAGLDVHHARIFGGCARRVVWIVDKCIPRLTLVHAPIHASRLNQIEIYFSVVQRKVLTPNDFTDLNALAERLLDSQYYWETTARPFEWKFTRRVLAVSELLSDRLSLRDCLFDFIGQLDVGLLRQSDFQLRLPLSLVPFLQ